MLYLLKSTNQFIRGKYTLKHREDMRLPYVNLRVDTPVFEFIADSDNDKTTSCTHVKEGNIMTISYLGNSAYSFKFTVKVQRYSQVNILTTDSAIHLRSITFPNLAPRYYSNLGNNETFSINEDIAFFHLWLFPDEEITITVSQPLQQIKKSVYFDRKVITELQTNDNLNNSALISFLNASDDISTTYLTKKLQDTKAPILTRFSDWADATSEDFDPDELLPNNLIVLDLARFKNIKYLRVPFYFDKVRIIGNKNTQYNFLGESWDTLDTLDEGIEKAHCSILHKNKNVVSNYWLDLNSFKTYGSYFCMGNNNSITRRYYVKGHINRIGRFAFFNSGDIEILDIILGKNPDSRVKPKIGTAAFSMSGIRKVRICTKGSLIIPPKCFLGCPILEEVEIFIKQPTGICRRPTPANRSRHLECVIFYSNSFAGCTNLRKISVIGLHTTNVDYILKIHQNAFNHTPLKQLYTDGEIRFVDNWAVGNKRDFSNAMTSDRYIGSLNCHKDQTSNPQLLCYARKFENISQNRNNYYTEMNAAMLSDDSICLFIEIK